MDVPARAPTEGCTFSVSMVGVSVLAVSAQQAYITITRRAAVDRLLKEACSDRSLPTHRRRKVLLSNG